MAMTIGMLVRPPTSRIGMLAGKRIMSGHACWRMNVRLVPS